ncbi:MAG TPA: AarF/ABC1/UbiB kinase family protein [Actinomycetes bacterium]|nr:AarF/ABC1/UbiB kinase family protein [Actinomycetes bacterium]
MTDLPRRAVTRSAKLATLPIGFAGRTVVGFGKRVGGRPAEAVLAEVQQRTAEQMFKVLGELKGGAMKVGQAMSVFEAALPEELAAPYRASLAQLQEAAPALPAEKVHQVMAEHIGPRWRTRFESFDDEPAAAASIGQVHRAVWRDGREVAVKIQYPGAGAALMSDLKQIGRMMRLVGPLAPGMDMKPLVAEMQSRMAEELDYHREARVQRRYAKTYADDPDFAIPDVVAVTDQVLVSTWLEGTPIRRIITDGDQSQRDRAGLLLVRFLYSGPARAGLLHADPHPGNFRLMPDGRLGVLDFGAVDRLPGGLPRPIGHLARLAIDGGADAVLAGLRKEGFVRPGVEVDAQTLLDYLLPLLEPVRNEQFHFRREWLRAEALRLADLRQATVGMKLNLPPSYLLIHRVTLGVMGVLCQLDCTAPFQAECERWVPGFARSTK